MMHGLDSETEFDEFIVVETSNYLKIFLFHL